ncbi:MAG: hypothetical protein PSV22_21530, partial [Pseudolabrys sp.]|nr:hypothetical protein [Pseudolabrys sp.]
MKASPLTLLKMRAPARAWRWLRHGPRYGARNGAGRCAVAAGLLATLVLGMAGQARAEEPVKGEIKVVNEANFTRLVFRLDEIVDSKVRQSGAILVIEFKKPVAIAV